MLLGLGQLAAFGLQFEREAAAILDGDHVRHATSDAKRLQDFGLDWAPIAAIGGMKCEHARRAACADMRKHSALNRGLGLGAASHGSSHEIR
jgi:hypothetical protein